MTQEEFIYNNRGINNDKDFSPEFLTDIYDRIKATPLGHKEPPKILGRDGKALPLEAQKIIREARQQVALATASAKTVAGARHQPRMGLGY
jgi:hypothetical protein